MLLSLPHIKTRSASIPGSSCDGRAMFKYICHGSGRSARPSLQWEEVWPSLLILLLSITFRPSLFSRLPSHTTASSLLIRRETAKAALGSTRAEPTKPPVMVARRLPSCSWISGYMRAVEMLKGRCESDLVVRLAAATYLSSCSLLTWQEIQS